MVLHFHWNLICVQLLKFIRNKIVIFKNRAFLFPIRQSYRFVQAVCPSLCFLKSRFLVMSVSSRSVCQSVYSLWSSTLTLLKASRVYLSKLNTHFKYLRRKISVVSCKGCVSYLKNWCYMCITKYIAYFAELLD